MLTIGTELTTFRVPRSILQSEHDIVLLRHAEAVELISGLNGEPVDEALFILALAHGEVSTEVEVHNDRERIVLCDGEGEHIVPYCKSTLERHFKNIWTLTLPESISYSDIERVLDQVIVHPGPTINLNGNLLAALAYLVPVSPLYHFLFKMEGLEHQIVRTLVDSFSLEDRQSLLASYDLQWMREKDKKPIYVIMEHIPSRGHDYCILASVQPGRDYLATEEGVKLIEAHTSWAFVNAVLADEKEVARDLFDRGFTEPCEALSTMDKNQVVRALLYFLPVCGESRVGRVCAMLGIRSTSLGNLSDKVYAPFQITVELSQSEKMEVLAIIGLYDKTLDE